MSEWDDFLAVDREPCDCRLDEDGLVIVSCLNHTNWRADQLLRDHLDAELDQVFRDMFGDRKFERSTATVANFKVRR